MPISQNDGTISFCRLVIPLQDFQALLRKHRATDPKTPDIEAQARALVACGFAAGVPEFVRAVCGWGGYSGVAGRVTKNNSPEKILAALRDASACLRDDDARAGLQSLLGLSGLGISFASKHLKFLDPERAVVLDSVISGHLGYLPSCDGYMEFLADCHDLRRRVVGANVAYPFPNEGAWRVSDIEMAIFARLRA